MPDYSLYVGNTPTIVNVGDAGALITNYGPSIVYYAAGKVSPTMNDGTLAVGSSITLYGSPHFTIDTRANGGVRADLTVIMQPSKAATGSSLPAASFGNYVRAPVVGRAESYGYTTISNGTDTGTNMRRAHKTPLPMSSFRVWYPGWGETGAVEADNPNDVTVRAALEYPSGTYTPLYFNGVRDVVIRAGQLFVESDRVAIQIPANAQFWTRTYLTVTGGQTWRGDYSGNATLGEACSSSAAEVDQTTSGTITGTAKMSGPCAIVSDYVPAVQPVIWALGDSIFKGAITSSAQGGSGQDPSGGWIERMLWGVLPYQRTSIFGTKASQFATTPWSRRQASLVNGCNIMLTGLGINDVSGSATVAQVQASWLTVWSQGSSRGMRVWQTTLTPVTDAGNTTPFAASAVRVACNDWLRAGAPISNGVAVAVGTAGALTAGSAGHPLYGYLEVADIVESSRNSGLWKLNTYTTDGTHPTLVGHAAIAAAMSPLTTFTLT